MPQTLRSHIPSVLIVSVYKTRCLPEGADLGFGGFPQQAKIRLGSTQTLLATTLIT